MTEQEAIKMNGWTFEETVKTSENLIESEKNMFKWDVLRHLRDFAELFFEELRQYWEIGTTKECRAAVEKQIPKKPNKCIGFTESLFVCPTCGRKQPIMYEQHYCKECGQKLDWSGDE